MAIVNYFNGKMYIEPSVDVQITNGIPVENVEAGYGKTLLIDTGLNATFGGGVGTKPVTTVPAYHIGNVDLLSGYDFTSPKTFTINSNGIGVVTVTLNADTNTLAELVAHINSRLYAANVKDVIAYNSGNYVAIATKQGGSTKTIVLAEGSGALAALGWIAATYTGSQTVGGGRVLQDMLYSFKNSASVKAFVTGGYFYDLASYLFDTNGINTGIPQLDIIRAAETSSANLVFSFSGKRLTLKTVYEGLCANGDITTVSGSLLKGFAVKLLAGRKNASKFRFVFYQGIYAGVDTNGYQFSELSAQQAANNPKQVLESEEFANISEFIAWAQSNQFFNQYFVIDTNNSDTSVDLVANDLVTYAGFNPFLGATETYNSGALTAALAELESSSYSFILSDKYAENGYTANNIAILNYINNKIGNKPQLIVGGFSTKDYRGDYASTDTTSSCGIASNFNSAFVEVLHDGDYAIDKANSKNKRFIPSIYVAAQMLGLKASIGASKSIIYKNVPSIKPTDIINNKAIDSAGNMGREDLIQMGVIHRRVDEIVGTVFNTDVNTMQSPDNLVYQTTDVNGNAVSYQNVSMQVKGELTRLIINYFKPKVVGKNSIEVTIPSLLNEFNTFMGNQVSSGLIAKFENLSVNRDGVAYSFKGKFKEPTILEDLFFELEASI